MSVQEKVKAFFQKLKEKWAAVSKKMKLILLFGLLAVVTAITVLVMVLVNQPYVTLFTNLNSTDMSAVVSYLSENGVTDYRVSGDNTIQVPENMENQLRANLLMAGYPASGFSYDTYLGNVGSLTTEEERKQLTLMELQDRTGATIRCLEGVRDAVVTINPAEDHSYVLNPQDTLAATAHVVVTLDSGDMLSDKQVEAIRTLMRTAVQGIEIENIGIVDNWGNTYSAETVMGSMQNASDLKLMLEERQNNLTRTQIMQVLVPMFGPENVFVSVHTTVDVDRKVIDATDYSMEDWAEENGGNGGRNIIGQEIYDQQVVRGEDEAVGGAVGTTTNSDLNTYVEEGLQTDGREELISDSGENNYIVDTEKTQTEHLSGVITDMTISVTINEEVMGGNSVPDLVNHVALAAGITEQANDKISILPGAFYQEPSPALPESILPDWAIYAALGGVVLFLLLVLIISLITRRRRRRRQRAVEAAAPVIAIPVEEMPKAGADIMEMETEKSMELRKEVRQFAETSPEIAAQIVRNWLS